MEAWREKTASVRGTGDLNDDGDDRLARVIGVELECTVERCSGAGTYGNGDAVRAIGLVGIEHDLDLLIGAADVQDAEGLLRLQHNPLLLVLTDDKAFKSDGVGLGCNDGGRDRDGDWDTQMRRTRIIRAEQQLTHPIASWTPFIQYDCCRVSGSVALSLW